MATIDVTLRPAVPMGHLTGVPHVVALAVCEQIPGARIMWPYDVVDGAPEADGFPLASVRTRAGYGDDGMFVECSVVGDELPEGLADAIAARVDAWAAGVQAGRAQAGPLAPLLNDVYDLQVLLGRRVAVMRMGRQIAEGTMAGMDIWGRACVRLDDGQELDVAPEQAQLRAI